MRQLAIVILLSLPPIAIAQTASAPLSGYYRIGHYIPVQFDVGAQKAATTLIISSDGSVETRIELPQGGSGIAPVLVTGTIREMTWRLVAGTKALAHGTVQADWRECGREPLVGITHVERSIQRPLLRMLVEHEKPPTVSLNAGEPLGGPASAWDAIDAIVLDDADQLDASRLPILLAGGMTIAVRSAARPDAIWPWQRRTVPSELPGEPAATYWLLSHRIRGPQASGVEDTAFRTAFIADWPKTFRTRMLLYAVAFSAAVLGAALLRRKLAAAVAVAIAALMVAGLAFWWRQPLPVKQRTATVTVIRQKMAQTDEWTYRASVGRGTDIVECGEFCRPLFSPEKGMPRRLTLICGEGGVPIRFEYATAPGMVVAFVHRIVTHELPPMPERPLEPSPLRQLVKDAYFASESWNMRRAEAQQITPDAEHWGAAIVEMPQ